MAINTASTNSIKMESMMRKILIVFALSAFICSSALLAADISGVWIFSQKNNEGQDDSFNVNIKAFGENLTVTGKHPKIGELAGTGTLKGDAIAITLNATGAEGKGALSFTYTGKLAGNKISGIKETKMSGTRDGGQGGAPGGGAPGAAAGQAVSNVWTAVKK
jgi:hypothetical protein